MSNFDLYKELDINDIVFVSGLARSGKSLACALISSFDDVDKISVNFSLEQIPCLNFLNKISYDTSVFLLQSSINLMIYENSIGMLISAPMTLLVSQIIKIQLII